MQEELHKWRRKDPVTVRRSMARPGGARKLTENVIQQMKWGIISLFYHEFIPVKDYKIKYVLYRCLLTWLKVKLYVIHAFSTEDLDRLLGERLNKLRSLPLYPNSALLSRVAPIYGSTSSSCAPAQLQSPCIPIRRPEYSNIQPQQPCYLPPAAAHPSNSFALYSPCGQPTATGGLNSPMAGKMPPDYSATLQAEYSVGPRSMQDFLLEGDTSYDIDMLNPSLTDLQLQGTRVRENMMDRKQTSRGHLMRN